MCIRTTGSFLGYALDSLLKIFKEIAAGSIMEKRVRIDNRGTDQG
jgi:hypothetical protein